MENNEMMKVVLFAGIAVAILILVILVLLFFVFDVPGTLRSRREKKNAQLVQGAEMRGSFAAYAPGQNDGSAITEEIGVKESAPAVDNTAPRTMEYGVNPMMSPKSPEQNRPETIEPMGTTQRLGEPDTYAPVQSFPVAVTPGTRFEIVKKVIVCDTQEVI